MERARQRQLEDNIRRRVEGHGATPGLRGLIQDSLASVLPFLHILRNTHDRDRVECRQRMHSYLEAVIAFLNVLQRRPELYVTFTLELWSQHKRDGCFERLLDALDPQRDLEPPPVAQRAHSGINGRSQVDEVPQVVSEPSVNSRVDNDLNTAEGSEPVVPPTYVPNITGEDNTQQLTERIAERSAVFEEDTRHEIPGLEQPIDSGQRDNVLLFDHESHVGADEVQQYFDEAPLDVLPLTEDWEVCELTSNSRVLQQQAPTENIEGQSIEIQSICSFPGPPSFPSISSFTSPGSDGTNRTICQFVLDSRCPQHQAPAENTEGQSIGIQSTSSSPPSFPSSISTPTSLGSDDELDSTPTTESFELTAPIPRFVDDLSWNADTSTSPPPPQSNYLVSENIVEINAVGPQVDAESPPEGDFMSDACVSLSDETAGNDRLSTRDHPLLSPTIRHSAVQTNLSIGGETVESSTCTSADLKPAQGSNGDGIGRVQGVERGMAVEETPLDENRRQMREFVSTNSLEWTVVGVVAMGFVLWLCRKLKSV